MSTLQAIRQCRELLGQALPVCLVGVQSTLGSVPRARGAWMAVHADGVAGTIGGGRLEYEAIAQAREWLLEQKQSPQESSSAIYEKDYPLGPALGQCCGGRVKLAFSLLEMGGLDALERQALDKLVPVALFGGGHVGQALVRLLSTLPFRIDWIDSRDDVFSSNSPSMKSVMGDPTLAVPNVTWEHSDPVHVSVPDLRPGAHVLIMSYSHAEDFDITVACLERQRERGDLPFIGLIGSQTKWATFSRRLRQRGFSEAEIAHVTCPIGVPGVQGKEPEVIAVAVAAQLLERASVASVAV